MWGVPHFPPTSPHFPPTLPFLRYLPDGALPPCPLPPFMTSLPALFPHFSPTNPLIFLPPIPPARQLRRPPPLRGGSDAEGSKRLPGRLLYSAFGGARGDVRAGHEGGGGWERGGGKHEQHSAVHRGQGEGGTEGGAEGGGEGGAAAVCPGDGGGHGHLHRPGGAGGAEGGREGGRGGGRDGGGDRFSPWPARRWQGWRKGGRA
ncbi:hypothetical protein Naga_102606g1 [Nannochloropsis gaditana]|uniref:Uncharacterized protein n=1 Tax=Nannochloropsis gaditana TaxID=72520 RepID=W7TG77_9STRA|nr:hypothetical protein Naga_102606g1 [Nannochloropsis gaditana]